MKVVCTTRLPDQLADETIYFCLYSKEKHHTDRIGYIAPTFYQDLKKKGIKPSNSVRDFASLAFSVAAADEALSRDNAVDGWTRMIDLTVDMIDPEPWFPIVDSIQNTLRFLSGDFWTIHLHRQPDQHQFNYESIQYDADSVCLLSGGTDSLIGAINMVEDGKRPIFISRVVRGDSEAQQTFAYRLGSPENHFQWSCTICKPTGFSEPSTRARSIIFFAYAVIASSIIDNNGIKVPIVVPENGFISLNPSLNVSRLSSLSTRTTHPVYMKGIQFILDTLGINAALCLPYQFKTKGEMILECQNKYLLNELIDSSISCGKYRRHNYCHCGVCVPCLVRRASYLHAGLEDHTEYRTTPSHETLSPDTTAVACAVLRYREQGIRSFTSGMLTFASREERPEYAGVIARGLNELGALLEGYGVI